MTDDEFQRRYHRFSTTDPHAAHVEAAKVLLAGGRHPKVVGLPFPGGVSYCLMLPRAAEFLTDLYGQVLDSDP